MQPRHLAEVLARRNTGGPERCAARADPRVAAIGNRRTGEASLRGAPVAYFSLGRVGRCPLRKPEECGPGLAPIAIFVAPCVKSVLQKLVVSPVLGHVARRKRRHLLRVIERRHPGISPYRVHDEGQHSQYQTHACEDDDHLHGKRFCRLRAAALGTTFSLRGRGTPHELQVGFQPRVGVIQRDWAGQELAQLANPVTEPRERRAARADPSGRPER